MNRREFIKISSLGTVIASSGIMSIPALAEADSITKLTILHTNDWHSRIEAFPMDGSRYQGLGGFAERAQLVKKIREENTNVLLLDCGDIIQGTPYFNFFKGETEFKLMNYLNYDAFTLGNHDFDGGLEQLAKNIKDYPINLLNSNYDLRNTPLGELNKQYQVFKFEHIKVGVFGVGIALEGLVPKKLYGETLYNDPVSKAQMIANILKHDENCDFVVCLSHLGFDYKDSKISDKLLAANTKNIDLILGGHTHSFLDEPLMVKNLDSKPVMINQAGWAGILLGRLDFYFKKSGRIFSRSSSNVKVSKKSI